MEKHDDGLDNTCSQHGDAVFLEYEEGSQQETNQPNKQSQGLFTFRSILFQLDITGKVHHPVSTEITG